MWRALGHFRSSAFEFMTDRYRESADVDGAGASPFDALSDDLVAQIIAEASKCEIAETGSNPGYSRNFHEALSFGGLVRLSHVSRRFRKLACNYQQFLSGVKAFDATLISKPSPSRSRSAAALELARTMWRSANALWRFAQAQLGLVNESAATGHGASSCLSSPCPLSSFLFTGLCGSLSAQLMELRFSFKGDMHMAPVVPVLASIQNFPRLEQLYIAFESRWLRDNMRTVAGPLYQGALQSLASLRVPLQALELREFPITLETLRSLGPLSPTLKRLSCGVVIGEAHALAIYMRPVFASTAVFQQLEQLRMEFYKYDEDTGRGYKVRISLREFDFQPLSSMPMPSLRAFAIGYEHLGFLQGMPGLEYVELSCLRTADISPLLNSAGRLRMATFSFLLQHALISDETGPMLFARTVTRFSELEILQLLVPSEILLACAQHPMTQWSNLKCLIVACQGSDKIPSAFLKRLGAEVPSLEFLVVGSISQLPLDSASGFDAVASLQHLRAIFTANYSTHMHAIQKLQRPKAHEVLKLKAALPHVELSIDTDINIPFN